MLPPHSPPTRSRTPTISRARWSMESQPCNLPSRAATLVSKTELINATRTRGHHPLGEKKKHPKPSHKNLTQNGQSCPSARSCRRTYPTLCPLFNGRSRTSKAPSDRAQAHARGSKCGLVHEKRTAVLLGPVSRRPVETASRSGNGQA